MELIRLALNARLPLVGVSTRDVINIEETLQAVSGEQVAKFKMADGKITLQKGVSIYYTLEEIPNQLQISLYNQLASIEKTLVVVNPEESLIITHCGALVTPKEMIEKMISEAVKDPSEVIDSFGGMNLKDASEVAKMSLTRDGTISLRGINATRRLYKGPRGLTQVDTSQDYYEPPIEISEWLEVNARFFKDHKFKSLCPRGLLFNGPPGTGKTMGAKYIASYFGVPLYHLDLSAMKDKYVGNSEQNLTAALAAVDEVEPCVMLIDEVEKIFSTSGDSHSVTTSMLSQILWWLQEHKTRVFTVMTTNDVSTIPKELYREGRIDQSIWFNGLTNQDQVSSFSTHYLESLLAKSNLNASNDVKAHLVGEMKMPKGGSMAQASAVKQITDLVRRAVADGTVYAA